jgi:hypothetical protein
MLTEFTSVMRSSDGLWYRLHATTWIAIVIIGAAVVSLDTVRDEAGATGSARTYSFYSQGWPITFLKGSETETLPQFVLVDNVNDWYFGGLIFDVVASLLIMSSTAVVFESWRRRKLAPWQFNLRAMLMATAVAAAVAVLYINEVPIPAILSDDGAVIQFGLSASPWYVVAAMLIGIGCTIFTVATAFWCVGTKLWLIARRRLTVLSDSTNSHT